MRHLLCAATALLSALCPTMAHAAQPQTASTLPAVVQTLVVLLGVCALAVVALRLGARRFATSPDAPMRVIARLPLEPRRSLFVVKVANRTMLLASSEAGIQPVGELEATDAMFFAANVSRETSEVTA